MIFYFSIKFNFKIIALGDECREDRPAVSRIVALFLISQIFLILHHKPLVQTVQELLLKVPEDDPSSATALAATPAALATHAKDDNITDEEKQMRMSSESTTRMSLHLQTILESLTAQENDYEALFALSLLYAIGQNKALGDPFWDTSDWKSIMISKIILLLSAGCQMTSKVRPVTIELGICLLLKLVASEDATSSSGSNVQLQDGDFALLEQAKEESIMVARTFYKVHCKTTK